MSLVFRYDISQPYGMSLHKFPSPFRKVISPATLINSIPVIKYKLIILSYTFLITSIYSMSLFFLPNSRFGLSEHVVFDYLKNSSLLV